MSGSTLPVKTFVPQIDSIVLGQNAFRTDRPPDRRSFHSVLVVDPFITRIGFAHVPNWDKRMFERFCLLEYW